jgi:tRNA A-37 threonylcarbamoyl transferase component Bud32
MGSNWMVFKRRKWHFHAKLTASLAVADSVIFESIFLLNAERVSKDDTGDVLCYETSEQVYYIKRFERTEGIRSWLGHSRLRMELRNLERFQQWGLNSPTVVGYGEDYMLSRTLRGMLITGGIARTKSLDLIASEQPELLQQSSWIHSVLRQVAVLTAKLHAKRFCHNDLFWRNLLVQDNADGPKVYVIDCPSGAFWRWPFLYKRRVKDLACLDKLAMHHLSIAQRLRFMHYYANALGIDGDIRQLIADVVKYPERRQKRKKRQDRFKRRANSTPDLT